MLALKFSEKEGLRLESDHAKPDIGHGEALIKVLRAGICSTVSIAFSVLHLYVSKLMALPATIKCYAGHDMHVKLLPHAMSHGEHERSTCLKHVSTL